MKRFRCGDVMPGCDVELIGDEPTILRAVAAHARRDHGIDVLPAEAEAAVRAAIVPEQRDAP
jgi:predicted small metal-binding protein